MTEPRVRFLLYSHDTYGLGHIRRTLAIASGLSESFPRASLLCVTGSPRAHSFPFPRRTDYLKLPAVTKNASGCYVSRELGISFRRVLALRTAVIDASVMTFQPHLILVDHSPLGMAGELLPALRRARRELPETPIVLGFRDIYDDGEFVRQSWRREGVTSVLQDFYDRILVYGQRDIFDTVQEYALPAAIARKITYTGYVHRSEEAVEPVKSIRARLGSEGAPLVLVTVGGGADGYKVVKDYVEGLVALGSRCHWKSLIVMGPLMSGWRRKATREAARKLCGVSVVDFIPRLRDCIDASDLVLTMGGYNTLVEALALGKRTLVVPRVAPRREQLLRAERFAEHGLVRWIDPRRSGPTDLVAAVRDVLPESPPSVAGRLDLGGVERTVRAVAELLGTPRSLPSPDDANLISSLIRPENPSVATQ